MVQRLCDTPNSGRLYFARLCAAATPAESLDCRIVNLGEGSDDVAVWEPVHSGALSDPSASPAGTWSATFSEDTPHRVVLRTENPTGGLLVLRDSWHPGWTATVDGPPAPIYRVNGCFRGVPLPPGTHQVLFLYRPMDLYAAAATTSAAGLLITLLMALGPTIRRRFERRTRRSRP